MAVTGAGSGIGLEIARLLSSKGAKVAICDIDRETEGYEEFNKPGSLSMVADVSQELNVLDFISKACKEFGGLDVLVNNAGIAGPTAPIEEINLSDWQRCINVTLTGQYLCAKAAVPAIKQAGGGAIVNISSVAGKHGYALRTPYSAAKFGVIGLTLSLAKELGEFNIRVNAILPGIVRGARIEAVIRDRAEATGCSYEETEASFLESVSLGRMVEARDVAATVAFLVSDAGRNITGQALAVDGNVEQL